MIKIGVLNDIHYDPFYDPKADTKSFCWSSDPFKSKISWRLQSGPLKEATYGRFGCDPNEHLIQTIMGKMTKGANIDVLLVNGDIVGHDIAVKETWNLPADKVEQYYVVLKDILATVGSWFIKENFKNSVVLPSLGNNDVKWHY